VRFYHIIGWADQNPVIIANSAQEAGEKYIKKTGLNFRTPPLRQTENSKKTDRDSACFGDLSTFPIQGWSVDPVISEQQLEDTCCFWVEPVCMGEAKCIECRGSSGLYLYLQEDIDFLAKLMDENASIL
jgi:hypothetical protein